MEAPLQTLVVVLLLCAVAVAVLGAAGVRQRFAPTTAVLRGGAQPAAVSVVLTGVITRPVLVGLALLVMVGAATGTSAHRLGGGRRLLLVAGGAIGPAPVPRCWSSSPSARSSPPAAACWPSAASSSATRWRSRRSPHVASSSRLTSTGTRWRDGSRSARGHGRPPATSRRAVHTALVPSIDQTRTTGIVTLPGAIFGGLSPPEAGRFQVIVLAAILAAGAIAAALAVRLLADVERRPVTPV